MEENYFSELLRRKLVDLEDFVYQQKTTASLKAWENIEDQLETFGIKLMEYKPLVHKRDEEKEWRMQFNENFYFGPAQRGIELNRKGIQFAKNGDLQNAFKMFEQANKHFSDGSNIKNSAILFNEAKCLLEYGDMAGIVLLINYFNSQKDNMDYSVEKLKNDFMFSYENGKFQGYLFEYWFEIELIDGKKISSIRTIPEMKQVHINIPYKDPVFLNLEGKDKDIITLQDYEYLWKYDCTKDGITDFEVLVPLKYWRKAFEFFNDEMMSQLEATYIPLIPFKRIFLSELDNTQLPEEAQDQKNTKVSLLKVSLPLKNERDFTQLFQHYLKPFFPSPLSAEETELMVELERMKEWESYQPDNSEKEVEYYNRFGGYEHCYALIYSYLVQGESGEQNPFSNLDADAYSEGRKKFQKFFPEIFIEHPIPKQLSVKYKERLSVLTNSIKSKEFASLIKYEFDEIISLSFLYKKPDASVFHMRKALEIIVMESYHKLNMDSNNTNLYSMIQGINLNNNKSHINTHMNDIRITANKIIHYSKDKKSQLKITNEESHELLRKLFIVSEFLVEVFEL